MEHVVLAEEDSARPGIYHDVRSQWLPMPASAWFRTCHAHYSQYRHPQREDSVLRLS